MSVRETAHHIIDGYQSRARALVEVQNGCDHRCTFCIIPFGRGPSRSVPVRDVVAQIRRLVAAGYHEVILTGVDMTSYGHDLADAPSLGRLVAQVLRDVPDLQRLRLSSIDSVEVDAELMDVIAYDQRLMPHLHLSLQMGDDMILKRMKRRHSRADAIRFCNEARRVRPDIVFGADLIAGFPTETDAMFGASRDLIDACGLTYLHVFPFSARAGTPAARMPQLAKSIIKSRAASLRATGRDVLAAFLNAQVGQTTSIVVERGGTGRTPQFADVALEPHDAPVGALRPVRITGTNEGRQLTGVLL